MNKEITNVSIDVLKVHPRNTEFFDDISGEEYERFKSSIQEEGIISEIIVAPDMTIISGHQRYKAAKDLGIKIVPVRIREDLIDEDKKLKTLLAANFGRNKNNESKQRKVALEYVKLCGYKNGEIGNGRKRDSHNGNPKLTLDEIAKQLGMSKANLTRALSIERNLTEPMKQLLDDGVISKTIAADLISSLSESEQEELISKLDVTQKYTQKQIQQYVDEIKILKEHPQTPEDYNSTKRELELYKRNNLQLKTQIEEKSKEMQSLREQIQAMNDSSPANQYEKKLKDSTIFFCTKVANFIEQVGGYVWLADKIDELPEFERGGYVKAVQAIKAWADTLEYNIEKNSKKEN